MISYMILTMMSPMIVSQHPPPPPVMSDGKSDGNQMISMWVYPLAQASLAEARSGAWRWRLGGAWQWWGADWSLDVLDSRSWSGTGRLHEITTQLGAAGEGMWRRHTKLPWSYQHKTKASVDTLNHISWYPTEFDIKSAGDPTEFKPPAEGTKEAYSPSSQEHRLADRATMHTKPIKNIAPQNVEKWGNKRRAFAACNFRVRRRTFSGRCEDPPARTGRTRWEICSASRRRRGAWPHNLRAWGLHHRKGIITIKSKVGCKCVSCQALCYDWWTFNRRSQLVLQTGSNEMHCVMIGEHKRGVMPRYYHHTTRKSRGGWNRGGSAMEFYWISSS